MANLTGLKMKDYVDYIKLMLGGSVLELENQQDLSSIVNASLQELRHYIADVRTITVAFSPKIDLSEYGIESITKVLRGKPVSGPYGYQDVFYLYSRLWGSNSTYSITDYANWLLAMQNKSELATDMDYRYEKVEQTLYIYAYLPLPQNITIEYIPIMSNVEEIVEPYWQDKLKRLSLAYAKINLGRIRSKYTLNNATYNLDGQQLLAEGAKEVEDLRNYLNQNLDLMLPLD